MLATGWTLPSGVTVQRRITALPPASGECASFGFEFDFPAQVALTHLASAEPLSCLGLYAAHALFAVDTDDVLQIWEVSGEGNSTFVWEGKFPEPTLRQAQKFYVSARGGIEARLFRRNFGVEVRLNSHAQLNHMGIWWCNSGWGDGREHRTVGIEPTTHPSDGPVFGPSLTAKPAAERNCLSFAMRVLVGD